MSFETHKAFIECIGLDNGEKKESRLIARARKREEKTNKQRKKRFKEILIIIVCLFPRGNCLTEDGCVCGDEGCKTVTKIFTQLAAYKKSGLHEWRKVWETASGRQGSGGLSF